MTPVLFSMVCGGAFCLGGIIGLGLGYALRVVDESGDV